MIGVLAAIAIMSAGVAAFLWITRADRRRRPEPTALRRRQIDRVHRQGDPISWQR